MKFLRNLVAASLGCLIAIGLFFAVSLVILVIAGSGDDGVVVKKNSILELSLRESILDYYGSSDDDAFASFFEQGIGLDEVINAIKSAGDDPKIKGISIKNSFLRTGLAQTQAIRKAIADFKATGKT
ncbi:MAG: signal peptide peptidase SppA, partial [Bacteroidota bacterium]